jgi:pimeloyl-ACP methyl ester carboxylesterase
MSNHEPIRKLWVVMSVFIAFAFLFIIPSTAILISNSSDFGTINLVYGQPDQINPNVATSLNIQNLPVKKVHVGDIDIAYKVFGKGDPILLVSGAGGDMNGWPPSTLRNLSSNHTVIVFDNRGIGKTTTGIKPFSIQQLANDTAGLLDALKIQKADVLGYSLGSFVAQQLTITHPEKVNRLILVAASCGGKESVPPSPQLVKMGIDLANKNVNHIPITPQEVKKLLSMSFGSGWIKLHPNYLENIPKAEDLFAGIPPNTQMQQIKAVQSWMATNWTGVCEELIKISNPALVITGTDDVIVPTANSLIIAGKIPGAWLVQIKDAGHQLPEQYPDKVNRVLQTFLSSTTG